MKKGLRCCRACPCAYLVCWRWYPNEEGAKTQSATLLFSTKVRQVPGRKLAAWHFSDLLVNS